MEQINKIEILGTVGNVRITEVGAIRMARVSVVVDTAATNHEGCPVLESSWFNCILWGTDNGPDCFDDIRRGSRIHIVGRIRMETYTDITGRQSTAWEILSPFGNYQITDGDNVRLEPQKA